MINMKNSNVSVKSKGVVVFAFNSATVDYVALADQTSRLTTKALGLPITLITDHDSVPAFNYDRVIRVESSGGNVRTTVDGQVVEWRNFGRHLAYSLSPYDETILLDGDYLVLDKSLLVLFEQDFDYRLMHNSHTPAGPCYQLMGSTSLPFVWATVVLFRKNLRTKQYFDLIARVQTNYSYYMSLYNGKGSYRNDYAFAIANNILNGYSLCQCKGVPWSMLTIEANINRIDLKNKFLIIRQESTADVISRQNLHVMDKHFLLSAEFAEFVNRICDES